MADRSFGSIASLMIRSSGNLKLLPPSRRCILHRLIHFAQERFPGPPQVACFDTAFHAELAEVACVLPISKELQLEGIQRYGVHGLSCESIVHQLGNDLPNRLLIAHLGNGASVTAVKGGKSIDTSMGLTPTGGVIMGTRSGDLDPNVLVYDA
jgi:acetate kinase